MTARPSSGTKSSLFRQGYWLTSLSPGMAVLALLFLGIMFWALTIGSSSIGLAEIAAALIHYDGSNAHLMIINVRLPRVLAGALVGSALAVSGAIMQAVSGNPLASPSLLGVNSGAAFAVVLAIFLGLGGSSSLYFWYAFAGGAGAAALVYTFSLLGRGGTAVLKLVLAGAVLSSFLASMTTALMLFHKQVLDEVRFWTVGSLSGRSLHNVGESLPFIALGLLAALAISREIMTLSLGEAISRGLGQNVVFWRFISILVAVALAASAVSLGGPIGFVGLVVPHIMRQLFTADYRALIPLCALGGGVLVMFADGLSRFVLDGRDMPVGIVMALIGAPFFIYLAAFRMRSRQ